MFQHSTRLTKLVTFPWDNLIILVSLTRWKKSSLSLSSCFEFDGVQDMLPPSMATWCTEYFKLKEFEKWGEAKPFWLPFSLLPWNRSENSRVEGALHTPRGKEHPYLWRQRDAKKNFNRLTKLPPFYYTYNLSYFYTVAHSSNLPCMYSGQTASSGLLLWRFLWLTDIK